MKTVLITGVSRGIGKALAQRFVKNGDFVIGTSTSGTANWSEDNLKLLQLDLSKSENIENFIKKVSLLDREIDILVNNAGIVVEEEVNESTINIDFLRKTFEVNLIGTIDLTEQVIPLMNSGGQIINISSRAGSLSQSYRLDYPIYKLSKVGINMFTRILASRLEGKITVSSVHPGWVKTDMGGEDGDLEPEEAAEDIFNLTHSNVETGQFWFKGEKFPW